MIRRNASRPGWFADWFEPSAVYSTRRCNAVDSGLDHSHLARRVTRPRNPATTGSSILVMLTVADCAGSPAAQMDVIST
ncbi:MAG TPA: hypothetical protein VF035_08850 [Longimicrobiales bacterium]